MHSISCAAPRGTRAFLTAKGLRLQKGKMSVNERAQDAFATLCSLYGAHNAQAIMRIRGSCTPRVARLALVLGRSRAAVNTARVYRQLSSLRGGYLKLMTAAKNDGSVKRIVDSAAESVAGKRFSAWEIDTAVAVLLAVIDEGKEARQ